LISKNEVFIKQQRTFHIYLYINKYIIWSLLQ